MKNQDFIITSLQSWETEIGSTIINTAIEISKRNRVLFVNPPLDYATLLRRNKTPEYIRNIKVLRGKATAIRQINENMWVMDCPFIVYSINHIPTSKLFDFFNFKNNKKIANEILKNINLLGFKNYIHIIDTDIYRSQYLKELIKPALSIYYCRDFVIGVDYWKKNGARLEPLLAKKSDIVLVNSTFFKKRFDLYNSNVFAIETGVNISLYNSSKDWQIPNDILDIPHPIVGYVGAIIQERLDSELLFTIAQKKANYSFVFVGPEDTFFQNHPIHQLQNVYFLGKKTIEMLPAYIAGFDICINPQIVNDITYGNYPLKIDEYLAMGKPTVATSTHTMQDIFKDYVYLPTNESEYLEALDKAIQDINNEKKKELRISFAHSHSWENSVKKIYQHIKSISRNETF